MKNEVLKQTEIYIRELFQTDSTGHDWWHVYRVWQAAKTIATHEAGADMFVVEMAALLHDLGDYKLSQNGEETAAQAIGQYLEKFSLASPIIDAIITVVDKVSFSKNVGKQENISLEAQIVRDADRLDALGAIGIARVFAYGGSKNRIMYDPAQKPQGYSSVQERRLSTSSSINHFYEKLLLLSGMMHTKTAKKMAKKRHVYMQKYLDEFYAEWEGTQ